MSEKFRKFAVRMNEGKEPKTKYYLYIDECGDQNLEHYDPNFPIFTLCGILVPEKNLNALNDAFRPFSQRMLKTRVADFSQINSY